MHSFFEQGSRAERWERDDGMNYLLLDAVSRSPPNRYSYLFLNLRLGVISADEVLNKYTDCPTTGWSLYAPALFWFGGQQVGYAVCPPVRSNVLHVCMYSK